MPQFLHAADLHVDSQMKSLDQLDRTVGDGLRDASRQALRNLIDLALARGVRFVVLAGDLFDDSHQSVEATLAIADELRRLSDAGIPTFLIRGNHDFLGNHSVRYWPEGVHELGAGAAETHRLDALGVAIHGRSFPVRHVTEDLTRSYPAAVPGLLNVGLLHTALEGHAEGHAGYAPTSLAALASLHYQYWALGHVHTHATYALEGGWAVYPGNLQGRGIHEQGTKGAVLVTWEGAAVTHVEPVACDVVRWHDRTYALPDGTLGEQLRTLAARLRDDTAPDRADGRRSAVRLRLQGLCADGQALPATDLRRQVLEALHAAMPGEVFLEKLKLDAGMPIVLPQALEQEIAAARGRLESQPGLEGLDAFCRGLWNRLGELGAEARQELGFADAEELRRQLVALGEQRVKTLADSSAHRR